MKRLLLALLLPFGISAKLKYDKEKNMYYSTKAHANINPERYHCLAEYCNFLIENARLDNLEMGSMFNFIREELIWDASEEAMLLYDDLNEMWNH